MCFSTGSYAAQTNVTTPNYSPTNAAEGVTESATPSNGMTATQLDPMATDTSGSTAGTGAPSAPSTAAPGVPQGSGLALGFAK